MDCDIRGLRILGTGRVLPEQRVTSEALDIRHGRESGFFEGATGVRERYFCTEESQIDLATRAAQIALDDAQLKPDDIDLVISAAAVPYQSIPATAPLIQRALGIQEGAAFGTDVNATCLSFPAALQMADALLGAGTYSRALIVSAELASRGLPWEAAPEIAGLFGDGAGAAVLEYAPGGSLRGAHFASFPALYDACSLASGGTRFDFETDRRAFEAHSQFHMDGKELFRVAAKHFGPFVEDLLDMAGTERGEINRVIAHQASPGALAHMIKLCGFTRDQVVDIAAEVGNQVAASIPFTLDYARREGLVGAGDRIALLGTSAGVSFGGLVMDI
ncbi:MAG: ketoacyl-ACP synthase III [Pseudomonadota bacterium]